MANIADLSACEATKGTVRSWGSALAVEPTPAAKTAESSGFTTKGSGKAGWRGTVAFILVDLTTPTLRGFRKRDSMALAVRRIPVALSPCHFFTILKLALNVTRQGAYSALG